MIQSKVNIERGERMSDREKQVMERLAENLKDMDDEDKNSLIERAEGMAYMNRKWRKKLETQEVT